MTDLLMPLLPQYGAVFLAVITFLSCIAVPVPASLVMLAGGAFAASGDLGLIPAASAAYIGAVLGDQAGFAIGRRGDRYLSDMATRRPKRAALIDRARAFSARYGAPGVFLSRWLVSPLGPYVNLLSGASRVHWGVFTLWGVLGEAVWVSGYFTLGFTFSGKIEEIASLLGNASGTLAAALVAGLLGAFLWSRAKEKARKSAPASASSAKAGKPVA